MSDEAPKFLIETTPSQARVTRSEALKQAVRLAGHQQTGHRKDVATVLHTAQAFEKYLNGETQ